MVVGTSLQPLASKTSDSEWENNSRLVIQSGQIDTRLVLKIFEMSGKMGYFLVGPHRTLFYFDFHSKQKGGRALEMPFGIATVFLLKVISRLLALELGKYPAMLVILDITYDANYYCCSSMPIKIVSGIS